MTLKPLFLLPFLAATPALAGSLAPTPVETQPVVDMSPAPAPVDYNWTGSSVGLQLGSGAADDEGGFVSGVRAGYDVDFGDWVGGGLIDYKHSNMEIGRDTELHSMTRVGGRLGYDTGRTLWYGNGGYAHGTLTGGDYKASSSGGYFVGLGAETFITPNVTLNSEVSYSEFNDFEGSTPEIGATVATIGVNYRF
ncbi:outer membrane beta-barrel protein [Citreicella sp. C3M06]|uniref:outer membrane protein n=1 Tax=Citreicella sp. C3M06 TaxID=2841564 RepID=UPI001C09EEBB|nr:outer membrane beta-barrel protein [Citreicella sp. C3M06]MBU2960437.1 outer membrane beta-barrel protein [Citreicella sp. C3M06]